jgi:predicted PurR-regulated permease PerM
LPCALFGIHLLCSADAGRFLFAIFFAYLLAAPVEYFERRYRGSHRRIKAIITAYVMLFGSITIWQQQLRWD